jgi:acetyltransferase-like isoleucine patch superfamily enzyme
VLPGWLYKPLRALWRLAGVPGDWLCCRLQGMPWRSDWKLHGWAYFRKPPGARIEIGRRFEALSTSRNNAIGVFQPVMLTALGKDTLISIGDDVGMSGCSITAMNKISIGNRVMIGSGVLIMDTDAHPLDAAARQRGEIAQGRPIQIDDDVFIGARAIVLKGVHIHRGAVIGAGAVVTRDVPEFAIVAGNPARVVGDWRAKKTCENRQEGGRESQVPAQDQGL